jgi:hypothetical protein
MKLIYDGRSTPGSRIEDKLPGPVRAALNEWAPVAARHDMQVAVPEHAGALVLGHADDDLLGDAAGWADATFELFAPGVAPAARAPNDSDDAAQPSTQRRHLMASKPNCLMLSNLRLARVRRTT